MHPIARKPLAGAAFIDGFFGIFAHGEALDRNH